MTAPVLQVSHCNQSKIYDEEFFHMLHVLPATHLQIMETLFESSHFKISKISRNVSNQKPELFLDRLIGQVGRVFANGPGDLGSIPCLVIPKTSKMVPDTALFNTQQYKVHVKGKVEKSKFY